MPAPGARTEEALRGTLMELLEDEGVRVVPAGTPGAAHVTVEISVDTGTGATGSGATFRAARARAALRLLGAGVTVEGRPRVTADANGSEDLLERSMTSLLPDIAAALAW